jgi:hypothetical protein
LEERGAALVAVAQGTGVEAARFCRGLRLGFPCLGDPGRRSYAEFGLARDTWWNVTVRPFLDQPRVAARRLRRASLRGSLMPHGDVLQLGGVAVVARGGRLAFLHRARRTDDYPPMERVLAELDRLRPSGA